MLMLTRKLNQIDSNNTTVWLECHKCQLILITMRVLLYWPKAHSIHFCLRKALWVLRQAHRDVALQQALLQLQSVKTTSSCWKTKFKCWRSKSGKSRKSMSKSSVIAPIQACKREHLTRCQLQTSVAHQTNSSLSRERQWKRVPAPPPNLAATSRCKALSTKANLTTIISK